MKKLKIIVFLLLLTGTVMSQTNIPASAVPVTPTTNTPTLPPPTPTPPSAPPPGYSNPPSWQSFRLGLEVEPLLSWGKAKANNISTSGVKPDFGFGLMGDFFFSKNYALNTGVTLVYLSAPVTYDDSEKFKISPKYFPANTTLDYKLQYVEIPIDFKLKTDQVGYMSYYGQFGGVLGVNIGSKGDFTTPGGVDNMSNVTLTNGVNLLNVGLLIGAGVEYNVVGHTNLMAGVSYVNNFTNFTGNPADAALNHFNLNLGVFF